ARAECDALNKDLEVIAQTHHDEIKNLNAKADYEKHELGNEVVQQKEHINRVYEKLNVAKEDLDRNIQLKEKLEADNNILKKHYDGIKNINIDVKMENNQLKEVVKEWNDVVEKLKHERDG